MSSKPKRCGQLPSLHSNPLPGLENRVFSWCCDHAPASAENSIGLPHSVTHVIKCDGHSWQCTAIIIQAIEITVVKRKLACHTISLQPVMNYNGRSEAMTLEVLAQVFDMLVVMLKSWRLEPDMLSQCVVELLDEHPGGPRSEHSILLVAVAAPRLRQNRTRDVRFLFAVPNLKSGGKLPGRKKHQDRLTTGDE